MADGARLLGRGDHDDLSEGLESRGESGQALGRDSIIIGDEDSLHGNYSL
jgi:hypothetical protein